jgi:O-acetyl-ADP-ribose deacetylase (regulator of RNase III)
VSNVHLAVGDITTAETDAIVNAANSALQAGGGVCGAIFRAAGPALTAACDAVPVSGGVRCPVGEARVTAAGNLPARYVIHAVGPRYGIDPDPAGLLASAYRNSYTLALDKGCRSVAVPAVSCGIFGYPLEEAATVALGTSLEPAFERLEITFYLFDREIHAVFAAVLRRLDGG